MARVIGVLTMVAGVIIGIWFGVWIAVKGATDFADGFKADPTDGLQIVWGFIQFWFLSWSGGIVVGAVIFVIGGGISELGEGQTRSSGPLSSPAGVSTWEAERRWEEFMRRPDPKDVKGDD
ncbi:hypothetical protein KBD20_00725 [Candidatus Saccharibacteria bacterium]|nr:hypothetical protein [Candidatus Saccharibacteria bacterium]